MSKTLLDDKDHWIATEGEDGSVLRVAEKHGDPIAGAHEALRNATVPLDKLCTALRRAHARRPWDAFFLDMAAQWAGQSKDPSTRVGAIIVDDNRHVISSGYNGFARGVEDTAERLNNREVKYPLTLHAELNAILRAGKLVETDHTIYIWPSPPCAPCASAIIQARDIDRIVCPPPSKDILSRWAPQLALAEEILFRRGIQIRFVGEAVEP